MKRIIKGFSVLVLSLMCILPVNIQAATGVTLRSIFAQVELAEIVAKSMYVDSIDTIIPMSKIESTSTLTITSDVTGEFDFTGMEKFIGLTHLSIKAPLIAIPAISEQPKLTNLSIKTTAALANTEIVLPEVANQVTSLSINWPTMENVPDFNLPLLERLTVISDAMKTTPDFTNLSNLKMLTVAGKNIEYLPNYSNLSNLKNLEIFTGDYTSVSKKEGKMTSIPNFDKLPNLEYLSVSGFGKIADVSNVLPNLNQLKTLVLVNLGLTEIPKIDNIPNLHTVDFSNNNITEFSLNVEQYPNLWRIMMSDNKISDLVNPPSFAQLEVFQMTRQKGELKAIDIEEKSVDTLAIELPILKQSYEYGATPKMYYSIDGSTFEIADFDKLTGMVNIPVSLLKNGSHQIILEMDGWINGYSGPDIKNPPPYKPTIVTLSEEQGNPWNSIYTVNLNISAAETTTPVEETTTPVGETTTPVGETTTQVGETTTQVGETTTQIESTVSQSEPNDSKNNLPKTGQVSKELAVLGLVFILVGFISIRFRK